MVASENNYIGKEIILTDKRDPLGSSQTCGKTSADYRIIVQKYKLFVENIDAVNDTILKMA